jgi:predicted GNAT family acetyltransferase
MALDLESEARGRSSRNASLIAALGHVNSDANLSDWEFDVLNDVEHGRWEAILLEDTIGEIPYRLVGGRVVLLSTWVARPYRQQRVATELIGRVLDDIRDSGKKITIICPVIGEFIARNPEYADLIDRAHPGAGAAPARAPQDQQEEQQLAAFERDLSASAH